MLNKLAAMKMSSNYKTLILSVLVNEHPDGVSIDNLSEITGIKKATLKKYPLKLLQNTDELISYDKTTVTLNPVDDIEAFKSALQAKINKFNSRGK